MTNYRDYSTDDCKRNSVAIFYQLQIRAPKLVTFSKHLYLSKQNSLLLSITHPLSTFWRSSKKTTPSLYQILSFAKCSYLLLKISSLHPAEKMIKRLLASLTRGKHSERQLLWVMLRKKTTAPKLQQTEVFGWEGNPTASRKTVVENGDEYALRQRALMRDCKIVKKRRRGFY